MFRSIFVALLFVLLMIGCGGEADVSETAVPAAQITEVEAATDTPVPTDTPEPTAAPTETAVPTETAPPQPTNIPAPTNTPIPTKPTATSEPVKEQPTEVPSKTLPIPTSRPLTDTSVDVYSIIEKSQTVSAQIKTVHMKSNMTMGLEGMTQNMDMDCDVEIAVGEDGPYENTYCLALMSFSMEGETAGMDFQFEMVQLDGLAWVRLDGEEHWEEAPQDDLTLSATNQLSLEDLEPYLLDAQIEGETIIDGEVVYEITFDIDMIAFMTSFLGEDLAGEMPEDLDEFSMSVRYWIGQNDLLTYKTVIEMMIQVEGETIDIVFNLSYSDYNAPVEIPDPREIESETEKGG